MADQFASKLKEMFEKVEPQFREAEIKAYRAQAEGQLATWLKRVAEGPVTASYGNHDRNRPPSYVTFKRENLNEKLGNRTFESGGQKYDFPLALDLNSSQDEARFVAYRKLAELGLFLANYEAAERDANRAVDGAKDHFLTKQSKKLRNACGERKVVKLDGHLVYRGVITGQLDVYVEGGDEFVLEMGMIVNHRYRPRFLSFYQFPARFTHSVIGGKKHGNQSEEWMAEHFAGKPLPVKPPPKPRRRRIWG